LPAADAEETLLANFHAQSSWPYLRNRHKGPARSMDLKQLIARMARIDAATLEVDLRKEGGLTLRPADVLRSVLGLGDAAIARVRIVKLREEETPTDPQDG
jgi:hypothetical protein